MEYAIVKDGIIENLIVAEKEFVDSLNVEYYQKQPHHKIGETYKVYQIKLDNQTTTINTQINILIAYQIFDLEQQKYITDTSIYKDVEIYVNDELIGTETILNGVGNIEFESEEAGTYKITIEGYSCEVIVNED